MAGPKPTTGHGSIHAAKDWARMADEGRSAKFPEIPVEDAQNGLAQFYGKRSVSHAEQGGANGAAMPPPFSTPTATERRPPPQGTDHSTGRGGWMVDWGEMTTPARQTGTDSEVSPQPQQGDRSYYDYY